MFCKQEGGYMKKILIVILSICCLFGMQAFFHDSSLSNIDLAFLNKGRYSFSMGGDFVSAWDNEGNLYSWGYNLYCQTGNIENSMLDYHRKSTNYFKKKVLLKDVKQVANGEWHSLILKTDGKLFSYGNNSYGQRGFEANKDLTGVVPDEQSSELLEINSDGKKIKNIYAKWMNSAFITTDHELYVWGNNEFGNLGNLSKGDLDEQTRDNYISYPLKIMDGVKKISFGKDHTAVLLLNGDVYVSGSNELGQLGINSNKKVITKFVKVYSNVKDVSCGFKNTYIIDSNDNLYGVGDNRFNQISSSKINNVSKFMLIDKDVCSVSAGTNFCGILRKNNDFYVIGSNSYGQLGNTSKETYIKNVREVSVGDNSIIIQKKNGKIYGFGSNLYSIFPSKNKKIKYPIKLN